MKNEQRNRNAPVTLCVKYVLHSYMPYMSIGNSKLKFFMPFLVNFDKGRSKGRDQLKIGAK